MKGKTIPLNKTTFQPIYFLKYIEIGILEAIRITYSMDQNPIIFFLKILVAQVISNLNYHLNNCVNFQKNTLYLL